jgi:hypothetical protein
MRQRHGQRIVTAFKPIELDGARSWSVSIGSLWPTRTYDANDLLARRRGEYEAKGRAERATPSSTRR